MPYKDKEFHARYRQQRRVAVRVYLEEYKVLRGCTDCGWNLHHAGLEFDHLKDKTKNIGAMLSYGLDKIKEELDKCEVVCGTCHNLRTYARETVKRIEMDESYLPPVPRYISWC